MLALRHHFFRRAAIVADGRTDYHGDSPGYFIKELRGQNSPLSNRDRHQIHFDICAMRAPALAVFASLAGRDTRAFGKRGNPQPSRLRAKPWAIN